MRLFLKIFLILYSFENYSQDSCYFNRKIAFKTNLLTTLIRGGELDVEHISGKYSFQIGGTVYERYSQLSDVKEISYCLLFESRYYFNKHVNFFNLEWIPYSGLYLRYKDSEIKYGLSEFDPFFPKYSLYGKYHTKSINYGLTGGLQLISKIGFTLNVFGALGYGNNLEIKILYEDLLKRDRTVLDYRNIFHVRTGLSCGFAF